MLLVTAGCSSSQPPAARTEAPSGIGLVNGILGLELSDAPAGSRSRTAASDLALVIHSEQAGGVTWSHLIVGDGTSGWTPRAFNSVRAVRVRPSARPFSLLTKSPDDADFSDAGETRVDGDADGEIAGASRRGRVAGNEQLQLPERYRRSLPWLKLTFGSTQGFAPLDWVALLSAPAVEIRSLAQGLDALGAKGLVWRPFLGALSDARAVTHVTAGAAYSLDDPASPPTKTDAPGEWNHLEFVFRDERGLMAVYADGPRRLFRFIQGSQPPVNIILASDFAVPVQATHRDVNADGSEEWLVEIAARYGDGFYAVLWIVDGRSAAGALRLQQLPLSRSTGESPSADVEASWALREDGTIQVVRDTAGRTTTTVYKYADRLVEVR